MVDASHGRLRHRLRAHVYERHRVQRDDHRDDRSRHQSDHRIVFQHVLGVLFPVAIVLIMLAGIVVVMIRDFGVMVMQFETPQNLMRVAHCEEQGDKQEQQAMGAKKRHPRINP